MQLLSRLGALEVEIYAAVLDKTTALRPEDPEDWYRRAYAEAARMAVEAHPRIVITLDKRYTKPALREALVVFMSAHVSRISTALSFVFEDSMHERALQMADVVAWSFFQKYARGDETYCRLIENRVRGETILAR